MGIRNNRGRRRARQPSAMTMNAIIVITVGIIAVQYHDGILLAFALSTPRTSTSSRTVTSVTSCRTATTTALSAWKSGAYSPDGRYSRSDDRREEDLGDEMWPDGQSGPNYDPPSYSDYEDQRKSRSGRSGLSQLSRGRGSRSSVRQPFPSRPQPLLPAEESQSNNGGNARRQQQQYDPWNNQKDKQRAYRESKFSRNPEWPQKPKNQFDNKFGKGAGDDFDDDKFWEGAGDGAGDDGDDGYIMETAAAARDSRVVGTATGNNKKYTEDFRTGARKPSSLGQASSGSAAYAGDFRSRPPSPPQQQQQQQQQKQQQKSDPNNNFKPPQMPLKPRDSFGNNQQQWQQQQEQQIKSNNQLPQSRPLPLPRPMLPRSALPSNQQGANIGDQYTQNFRRGSKSGGYNYRNDFGYGGRGIGIPGVGGTTSFGTKTWSPTSKNKRGDGREANFDEYDDELLENWGLADLGRQPGQVPGQRGKFTQRDQQGRDQGRDFGRSAGGANYQYYNKDPPTPPLPGSVTSRGAQQRNGQQRKVQTQGDVGRSSPSGANYQYYNDSSRSSSKQPKRKSLQSVSFFDKYGQRNTGSRVMSGSSDDGNKDEGYDESQSPPPLSPPGLEVDEYGFGKRVPMREYDAFKAIGGSSVNSDEPTQRANGGDLEWRERQNTFDQWRVEQGQGRGPNQSASPITQQRQQNKPNQQRKTEKFGKYGSYRPSEPFNPLGGIKNFFDKLLSPGAFSPDRMMGRVNSEIDKSIANDREATKALLAVARDCLLADPSVQNLLGQGNISLGNPLSKSSSSDTVNGVTESRLRMDIPITGNLDTGRLLLVANQDGIELLELDVAGGGWVNVDVSRVGRDGSIRRGDGMVDSELY